MWVRINIIVISLIFFAYVLSFAEMWQENWLSYKKRFISEDGRVVDYYNNSISHSEGQGYVMLLSVYFNDIETFQRVWQWTKNNLQVRKSDSLLAWSWGLHISGKWTVLDYNNASDGDTLVAYSLFLAGDRWKRKEYIEEAKKITRDIREILIIKKESSYFLLPGYYGFYHKEGSLILNPSYYVLSAYKVFAVYEDKNFWNNFYSESLKFLKNLEFSTLRLSPDWIVIKDGKVSIFSEKSNNFGIEAIRIPLYLTLAGENRLLENYKNYIELIEKIGYVPMEIDLRHEKLSAKEGFAMHYIIASAIAKKLGKKNLADALMRRGVEKLKYEDNYYSHTLSLLLLKSEVN